MSAKVQAEPGSRIIDRLTSLGLLPPEYAGMLAVTIWRAVFLAGAFGWAQWYPDFSIATLRTACRSMEKLVSALDVSWKPEQRLSESQVFARELVDGRATHQLHSSLDLGAH